MGTRFQRPALSEPSLRSWKHERRAFGGSVRNATPLIQKQPASLYSLSLAIASSKTFPSAYQHMKSLALATRMTIALLKLVVHRLTKRLFWRRVVAWSTLAIDNRFGVGETIVCDKTTRCGIPCKTTRIKVALVIFRHVHNYAWLDFAKLMYEFHYSPSYAMKIARYNYIIRTDWKSRYWVSFGRESTAAQLRPSTGRSQRWPELDLAASPSPCRYWNRYGAKSGCVVL